MSESQYLSIIRIWAAMAWADGVIADAEAVAMKRLIEAAELSGQERTTALGWLETKVELETGGVGELGDSARLGVYRAAARLAAVDLEVADEERALLGRLRELLNIDEDTAKKIEADIPGHN
jgi:uncharacterized membrane protein YebE (DUF533 family)